MVAAEDLKTAITELVGTENLKKLLSDKDDRTLFSAAVKKVRAALDSYAEQLDDTLTHGHQPGQGVWEKAQVEELSKSLSDFTKAVETSRFKIKVPP